MRIFSRFSSLCLLLCFCAASLPFRSMAQSAPSKNIADLLQRQLGWDDALPDEKNPDGLQFRFSKIDEATTPGGRLLRYRAYVAGTSETKKYALGSWKLGQDLQILPVDVYVNAKGLLMVHKPRPDQENSDSVADEDELDLAFTAARGEPVRFALVSTDKSFMVPGTIVPFPIEASGATCHIEMRLAQPEGQAILVYADGLKPNSTVPFKAISGGDLEAPTFSVNARGHAATADLPYADGTSSGTLKIDVAAKGCAVSLEIPWGKGSYHPF
jgi:hypothetical protein